MTEKIFKPGDKLDAQWTIRKIIDSGGMSTVYQIVSPNDILLAAKTFKHRFFNSPPIIGLFIQEAQNWINLPAHPNVVEARYVRKIEGKPYLFLDFVSGCTLREFLWRGYSFETGLNYGIQICQGMAHIHKAGLIHRDLKPENILVNEFYPYQVKITDLGIAKVKQELNELSDLPVTGPGAGEKASGFHGTPLYMAPELISKKITFASDIYSFGVLLFEMLTGQHPFPQISELYQYFNNLPHENLEGRILLPIFVGQLPDPEELNPIIPDGLKKLIIRCINIDPDLRPQSFDEISRELTELYEQITGSKFYPIQLMNSEEEVWYFLRRANSDLYLEQYESGLVWAEKALAVNPEFLNALNTKGLILSAQNRTEDAIECFLQKLKINPVDGDAMNNLATLYNQSGDFEKGLDYCNQALAINPDNWQAIHSKGVSLDETGKHEEALVCFDQCLKFNRQHVNSWSSKGNVLTKLRWFDEAEKCLDTALHINPMDLYSINNMIVLYSAQKKFREALDWSDKLMEISPDYPLLAFSRASILFELERFEEAYLLLKDASFPEKFKPAALLLKLECLAVMTYLHPSPENYSAFVRAVEEFQALYPEKNIREELIDILRMNPFDMHLEIERKTGKHSPNRLKAMEKDIEGQKSLNYYSNWEGAKSLFLEAIALDPTFMDPYTNLGVALEKTGHIDAAIQSYNNALAIQPDYFMALFNKGNCFRKLNNYPEALKCYNDSLKQNNTFFQTWVFKGICHLELGQWEEAETSLLKTLELNPGYPFAIDLLRDLRQARF